MKTTFLTCLILLLASSVLLAAPAAGEPAKQQPTMEKPDRKQTVNAEDLKVIALMDLLQKMEMLKDFKILSAGEEKQ